MNSLHLAEGRRRTEVYKQSLLLELLDLTLLGPLLRGCSSAWSRRMAVQSHGWSSCRRLRPAAARLDMSSSTARDGRSPRFVGEASTALLFPPLPPAATQATVALRSSRSRLRSRPASRYRGRASVRRRDRHGCRTAPLIIARTGLHVSNFLLGFILISLMQAWMLDGHTTTYMQHSAASTPIHGDFISEMSDASRRVHGACASAAAVKSCVPVFVTSPDDHGIVSCSMSCSRGEQGTHAPGDARGCVMGCVRGSTVGRAGRARVVLAFA